MVPFVMVSGELNTDSTDATGFSQMSVVTDCPPETGATSEAEGVDCFPSFCLQRYCTNPALCEIERDRAR